MMENLWQKVNQWNEDKCEAMRKRLRTKLVMRTAVNIRGSRTRHR